MGYGGFKRDRPSRLTQAISTLYPLRGNNFHQHPPLSREHKGRGSPLPLPRNRTNASIQARHHRKSESRSMHVKGKVCVVTGGASGIGEATARAYAAAGARGVVVADLRTSRDRLAAAAGGPHRPPGPRGARRG